MGATTGADARDDGAQSWVWTDRSLLVLFISAIPMIVAEIMVLLALASVAVFAGGVSGGDAGAVVGGLVGLLVTLGATLLGLLGWAVIALAGAALALVAALVHGEGGDRHRMLASVGALLLIGSVLGTLAADAGMLVGLSFVGEGAIDVATAATGLVVLAAGVVGLVLIPFEHQGPEGRPYLYAVAGLGVGAGVVAVVGGVTAPALLGAVAAGLAAAAHGVYAWVVHRTRRRLKAGEPTPAPREAAAREPEASGAEATREASTPAPETDEGMVVACSECGAHLPVETDERPVVVQCPECGQRGVVKAPPPGGVDTGEAEAAPDAGLTGVRQAEEE